MARVRPFAAFRYAHEASDISALTAPPYDVISADQRETLLAGDPHNVVALELPGGPLDPRVAGNRYETGAATWARWRKEGVLVQDPEPAVYVLEQRFTHEGHPVRRRAFIVEVGLEPFSAGVVLPHERTLPKALGDRFELTKATRANLSQVFGLFDDASHATDELFDAAMVTSPVAEATDADGVRSVLWAITDPEFSRALAVLMAEKQIFIADGHHRYTTALAYRDHRREAAMADGGEPPVDPDYDSVMMALVNMDDPELLVLPTHRVADAPADFDAGSFWSALSQNFTVDVLPSDALDSALDQCRRPAFLVRVRGDESVRLVTVRDDVDLGMAISAARSPEWKALDVAVLQELILDPLLDIHPDRAQTLDRLSFVKDSDSALQAAETHDAVFILRPTSMSQLRQVAVGGETMPQKSTYFFPKLLSGLVFRAAD